MSYTPPVTTPSNLGGQLAALWGLGKILYPVSSTSLHPMLKKVPTPEGAVWPQGRPKQLRMADAVRPFQLAWGSKFADPGRSAPVILQPLHPNKSRCLAPEQCFPQNPDPRRQGAPPTTTVGIILPRAPMNAQDVSLSRTSTAMGMYALIQGCRCPTNHSNYSRPLQARTLGT